MRHAEEKIVKLGTVSAAVSADRMQGADGVGRGQRRVLLAYGPEARLHGKGIPQGIQYK